MIDHLRKQKLKQLHLILGLIILLGIQSCTSLNNIYYWADTYLAWEIDNYFDLTDEQEIFVEQKLDLLLLVYKDQEIGKYIEFLQEIKARSAQNLSQSDLEWLRMSLTQFNVNIANLLVDDTSIFLAGLQEYQIPYFKKKLAESNEDWLEEYKKRLDQSDDEKLEKRFEGIEKWIGDITEDQKQKIVALYPPRGSNQKARFDRRVKSQQRFLDILEQKDNPEFRDMLMDWYLNPDRHYSKEYKEHTKERDIKSNQLILMLDQTATQKQRQFFHQKLDGYIRQLEKILSG